PRRSRDSETRSRRRRRYSGPWTRTNSLTSAREPTLDESFGQPREPPQQPGDRPGDAVPDAVRPRPATDHDLVRLAGSRRELGDLVAVVVRGGGRDLGAAAVADEQVEVDREGRRGGRVPRRGRRDGAVPRERDLHLREQDQRRHLHVVAEGRETVAPHDGGRERPDVPAAACR